MKKTAVACSLLLAATASLLAPSLKAQSVTVCLSGCDFDDLGDAVDSGAGEVVIYPGTWVGNVELQDGQTLRSRDLDPSTTVLQGDPDAFVNETVKGRDVSIVGLTVTGADTSGASGIELAGESVVRNCIVTGNTYGVFVAESAETLVLDTQIVGNTYGSNVFGALTIRGESEVSNNTNQGVLVQGFFDTSKAFVYDSVIESNGDFGVSGPFGSRVILERSRVAGNRGGVSLERGSIVDSEILDSTELPGVYSEFGWGPFEIGEPLTVENSVITGNAGGGVVVFYEEYCDTAVVETDLVQGNGTLDAGYCDCTVGETRPCNTGFQGVAGEQVCQVSSFWSLCDASTPPQPEICDNGADDDRNGYTDGSDSACIDNEGTSVDNTPSAGSDQDPVSTYTGELFEVFEPDLDLGGPMPVHFSRYYASALEPNGWSGRLGPNWRHNYEWTFLDGGTTVDVVGPRGRALHFDLIGDEWQLAPGIDVVYELVEPVDGEFFLGDLRSGMVYAFENDLLVGIEDGRQVSLTLTYSGSDLMQVADGLGRALDFGYTSGRLTSVTDPNPAGARSVTFAHTGDDLTSSTDLRGKTTTYSYDGASRLLSWTRPRLNVPYVQTYDGSGRVATQTDSDGHTHTFAYDTPGPLQTTITDPLSGVSIHTHALHGELLAVEDEESEVYELGYSDHRRTAVHDRLGGSTFYGYDEENGLVDLIQNADGTQTRIEYGPRVVRGILFWSVAEVEHADGTTESFVFTDSGDVVRRTDRGGFEWLYEVDGNGQVTKITNPEGGVTTVTYNADGTMATRTDDAGNTTSYGYDDLRRLDEIEHADLTTRTFLWHPAADLLLETTDERSNTTTFTYDDNGNLSTIENALGEVVTFEYDGNDRLLSVEDDLGHVASQTWDELGRVATRTDRSGRTTTFGYDSRSRLASITDPASKVWTSVFDHEGILSGMTDPLGHATLYGSDDLGRITSATSTLSNVFGTAYDSMGRVVARTNPEGEVTSFDYDARGLVAEIDEEGLTLGFTRDGQGLVTAMTDGNGEDWLRGRDPQGRVISRTDPLSRVETTTYDDRNRPDVVTLPGGLGTLTHTYDDAGNVTELDYQPSGPTLTYVYDALNRLTSADGVTFDYDEAGRLIESNGLVMTWDEAGRLESIDYDPDPVGEKLVEYAYDARGLLESVTDWVSGTTTFGHDDAGRMVTASRPNGVTTTWTWDDDDRLVGISEDGGSPISSIALTRDRAGRITRSSRSVPLSADASAVTAATFSHDAASQIDSAGYVYDAMGRLTSDPTRTYTWDLASRLLSVDDGSVVSFGYDGLGMRVSRTDVSGTRTYVWNHGLGLPSVNVEREGGSDLRYYVHSPDGALLYSLEVVGAALRAPEGARRDYHFDEMGNTMFQTGSSGDVVAAWAHGPLGEALGETGDGDNHLTWQGRKGTRREGVDLFYADGHWYSGESRGLLDVDVTVVSPDVLLRKPELNPRPGSWPALTEWLAPDFVEAFEIMDRALGQGKFDLEKGHSRLLLLFASMVGADTIKETRQRMQRDEEAYWEKVRAQRRELGEWLAERRDREMRHAQSLLPSAGVDGRTAFVVGPTGLDELVDRTVFFVGPPGLDDLIVPSDASRQPGSEGEWAASFASTAVNPFELHSLREAPKCSDPGGTAIWWIDP